MIFLLMMMFVACNERKEESADLNDTAFENTQETSTMDTAVVEDTGHAEDTADTQEPSGPVGDAVHGEALVQNNCMGCHGGNPQIQNVAYLTDADLVSLFENGSGYMPAVPLSEQETLDVIAYLRQIYGGPN
ncbi:MAG: cytochrome c [Myxococcota bacterium]|nr:cytochrome c [Myxococcota bacterium]